MKECFLIMSYCDSNDKIKVLCETINMLSKYNIDICLYATYPLPQSIHELATYYIYDSDNALINRQIYIYRSTLHRRLKINHLDYGFAVLQQFKRGTLFLHDKYDIVHVVNYDVDFSNNFFEENSENLKNSNAVFYYKNGLTPYFFSVKPNNMMNFFDQINRENYLNMPSNWIMEEFLDDLVTKNENVNQIMKITADKIMDATNKLSAEGFELSQKVTLNLFYKLMFPSCRIFLGQRVVDNKHFGLFDILIYDIQQDIQVDIQMGADNISSFKRGGKASSLFISDDIGNMSFLSFETHMTYDEFVSGYNSGEVSIKIDGEEVLTEDIIKLVKNAEIQYLE